MQVRLLSNVETRRLPEARWQRRVVVRSSRLLRFWVKAPNTNSEIGHNLPRARPRVQNIGQTSPRAKSETHHVIGAFLAMDPGVERQTNEKNQQPRRRHEYDAEQRADVQRRIIID